MHNMHVLIVWQHLLDTGIFKSLIKYLEDLNKWFLLNGDN